MVANFPNFNFIIISFFSFTLNLKDGFNLFPLAGTLQISSELHFQKAFNSSLIPSVKALSYCRSRDEVKSGVRYLEATFRAKKQKICSNCSDYSPRSAIQSNNGSYQPFQALFRPQVPGLLHDRLGFRHRCSVLLCCCSAHLGPQIAHGRHQLLPRVLDHHLISFSGTDSIRFDFLVVELEFPISFGVINFKRVQPPWNRTVLVC